MQCAACGTINPTQARFCMGCGLRLTAGVVCGACHTLLPPQAQYCYNCGQYVGSAGAALSGVPFNAGSYVAAPPPPAAQPGRAAPVQAAQPAAPIAAQPAAQAVAQAAAEFIAAQAVSASPAAPDEHQVGVLPPAKKLEELREALEPFLTEKLYGPLQRRPNQQQIEAARDHLKSMLETAKTYLPQPVIVSPQPGGVPAGGMYLGAFLFVDVSGFTPLSEQLKKEGQAGAEKIVQIINGLFTELVRVLFDHGGTLLKFGGDAMLGLFQAADEVELRASVVRAAQAALAMQTVMQAERFASIQAGGETRTLKVKCGISSGRYFAAHIGTPEMMSFVTTGHTVNRAEQAEGHAEPGQVAMLRESYDLAQDVLEVGPAEKEPDESYVRLLNVPPLADSSARFSLPEPPDGELMAQLTYLTERLARLRPYLPGELVDRIKSNPDTAHIAPDHRPVTVMFANYVGISDLIQDMGDSEPGIIVQQLNDYFVHMAKIVSQYEGTLARMDQYAVGDRLVIFFGAPRAHEDDPVRAVSTALSMQKAVYDHFSALQTVSGIYRFRQRIGINTGQLFAGNAGAPDLRQEYTLMGDDINMAARLMSKAGWGEIYVSRKTKERVSAYFDLEDKGELKVKGKEIRIPTYKVLGKRGEVGQTRGLAGGDSPLTGRGEQLALLEHCAQSLLNGRGQIVSIMGDSGLGKSRLTRELRAAFFANPEAENVRWLEGQCMSFSEDMSYFLAGQIVLNLLGLGPEDRQEDVLFNLWEMGEDLLGKETAREAVPFLANMLGLELKSEWATWVHELDPKVRLKQIFWAVREFFAAAARKQPLVISLDDLHWADENSLELLADLISISNRVPVMFVFVFRPMRQKGCWTLHEAAEENLHHRYTALELVPLSRRQSEEMLGQLLPGAELPVEVVDEIFAKSAGNPFYLEEVVRSIMDSEAVVKVSAEGEPAEWRFDPSKSGELRVPDSLHSAIIARIDRLTEDARQALQMAAVIGRQFQSELLRHLAHAEAESSIMLDQLEQHKLIRPLEMSMDETFIFPDALVQEVAYENLLMQRRQEFHLKIAQALEDSLGERSEEECALLAHHYSRSSDSKRALRYLDMAAQRAQAAFANETAILMYTRLLEILGDSPEEWERRFAVLMQLQRVYGMAGRQKEREGRLNEMRQIAETHSDENRLADVLNELADLCGWTGRYDEAIAAAGQALEIKVRCADPAGQAMALHQLGVVSYYRNDYGPAREHLTKAVALRRELNDADGLLWSLIYNYMIYFMTGEYDQAITLNTSALETARARQDWFQIGIQLTNAVRINLRLGEYELAEEQLKESLEMKTRVGDRIGQGFALFAIGLANQAQGKLVEARQAFEQSLELRQVIGDRRGVSYSTQGLGLVDLDEGNFAQAAERLRQAYEQRQELGLKGEALADLSFLSQALLGSGDTAGALQASQQAMDGLTSGIKVEEVQNVYLHHYRVLSQSGQPGAQEALAAARQVVLSQAECIADEHMRERFLSKVKVNREIMALSQ